MQRSLRTDTRGSIAVITALSAMVLIAIAGGAIDLHRAHAAKSEMQNRLDAAVLAGGLELGGAEGAAAETANRFFGDHAGAQVRFFEDQSAVHGAATTQTPTFFLQIIGINQIEATLQSAATRSGGSDFELMMVLDVSGSMKGNGKIEALRTASVELVDALFGDADTLPASWIGIVPFSGRVNVIDYGRDWITTTNASGSTSSTRGRGNGRPPPNSGGGSSNTQDASKLCTGLRSLPNEETDAPPSVEAFPAFAGDSKVCPGPKVVPLTQRKSTIRLALQSLYTGDGTSTQVGMAWGWRTISPRWQGEWGDAALPLSAQDTPGKIVIIMTDGENHPNQSGDPFDEDEANARLLRTCAGMRAEGITIYAVAFMMKGALTELYEECAGDPERVFDPEGNAALIESFGEIGSAINRSRLRLIE